MNLFNRRKKQVVDPSLPPEVQAYSQAERRERMGIAWLVGIVSLVVSLVLITGLFFGGRWVYRKVAHKDNKAVPAVTSDQDSSNDKNKDTNNSSDNSSTDSSNNSGNNDQSSDTATNQPTTGSNNTPPATTPTQQPVTGDQSTTLPNTGPDVDL